MMTKKGRIFTRDLRGLTVAGVLFGLHYSIHQHALALDVIHVIHVPDGRNDFQSC